MDSPMPLLNNGYCSSDRPPLRKRAALSRAGISMSSWLQHHISTQLYLWLSYHMDNKCGVHRPTPLQRQTLSVLRWEGFSKSAVNATAIIATTRCLLIIRSPLNSQGASMIFPGKMRLESRVYSPASNVSSASRVGNQGNISRSCQRVVVKADKASAWCQNNASNLRLILLHQRVCFYWKKSSKSII
jgi:hypothetical protein